MKAMASYTVTKVKDGNDFDVFVVEFILTNSGTEAPSQNDLGWSETMPEYAPGMFLWTRNKIYINDPEEEFPIIIYTDPLLDTAWEKLDELNKRGTDIQELVDSVTIRYYDSTGKETSFKLSDGALDISFLKGQIDGAEKVATNFISITENGGIEVGNKSGGSWQGYRTQMLADRFCIVDENDKELASYEANAIYLGKSDNKDTVIDFNNGMVILNYDADRKSAMMKANRMFISSNTGYEISIGSSITNAGNNVVGGQVYCDSNGSHVSGFSGDSFSVDLYTEMYLRNDGRGLWESVGTDSDGYFQSCSIEMWPHKLQIRGKTQASFWDRGRDAAILTATRGTETSLYYPVIDAKCKTGDWSMGCLNDEWYFVYTKDSDYAPGNNVTSKFGIRNDGMPLLNGDTPLIEYGTWTPMLQNLSGNNPTVSYNWNSGYYYRIGNMVFISCDISPTISNAGGSIAFIAGLPYTNIGSYAGLSMCEGYNVFNHGQTGWNIVARVEAADSIIRFQSPTGSSALNWIVNAGVSSYSPILRFSGWYRIA